MADYICKDCGYAKTAKDELIGKKAQCPMCKVVNPIVASAASTESAPGVVAEPAPEATTEDSWSALASASATSEGALSPTADAPESAEGAPVAAAGAVRRTATTTPASSGGMGAKFKAIAGVLVVLAIIGFKVWNRTPHYRESMSDTLTVQTESYGGFEFSMEKYGRLKLELSNVKGGKYSVFVFNTKNMARFEKVMDGKSEEEVRSIFKKLEAQGDLAHEDIFLKAGRYSVIILNLDEKPLNCELVLSEYI